MGAQPPQNPKKLDKDKSKRSNSKKAIPMQNFGYQLHDFVCCWERYKTGGFNHDWDCDIGGPTDWSGQFFFDEDWSYD
jgi:hypothetical protein